MKTMQRRLSSLGLALTAIALLSYSTAQACDTCAKHNPTATPGAAGQDHKHLDEEEGFETLFDANHTEGWTFDKEMIKIEDGAIVMGTMDKAIPKHRYAVYAKEYYNFELRLQVKVVGPENANGGVQFRSKYNAEKDDMSGFQADVGHKYWGRLYDQSRRNSLLGKHDEGFTVEKNVKQGEWNDYVVRAEGARIQVWINGQLATDYTEDKEEFIKATGQIGLQLHSGPASVRYYRNIRIKELK